ncbi:16S rRNA (uracil(1498)-N(3))-methyltransferase [Falsibacillus albus]|uniref:Ribosomal RNA small subunit methyltransferase E n=1 Tax=Falsibacillus albus TaxID=2478915 RepID=A0A3L7KC58_9BACI|nr:16S rRNA (uracil(1498)-N(3))-methyltransferase [Falsibacillus albus]RLQ98172.1 16S rRNA (uracil(1498)-N(3))-methyltransferase [Falsibacillus albus]
MQRYFLDEPYRGEGPITLEGEHFHHISRVMRMKEGDAFYTVFPNRDAAKAVIENITNDQVIASIVEWEKGTNELPVDVTIASGLPKGDKLELIIQKGTELGAAEFVPFMADRSIVKLDEKKAGKKTERWNKIALEAAEQSHRHSVPLVHSPVSFKLLLDMSKKFDYKVVAYEEEGKKGEKSNFAKFLTEMDQGKNVMIVFGPEGGLSDKEITVFESNGFTVCGLGPRILRTETAPLYALSAISYQFELLR